jgi:hypothetical protein
MKKVLFSLFAISLLSLLAGCATQATLPTGAVDSVDANANEILQPAHAFAVTITAAVQSTDPNVHIELSPAQKTALIDLNKALNLADALEIAYHGTPTAANANALKAAAANVSTAFGTVQSTLGATLTAK